MGRLNDNPEQQTRESNHPSEQQIQHFSHPHVLHLTNQPQNPNNVCFACKLTLSGPTYSCLHCNYFLHLSCAQKPKKIKHPFDLKGHTLHLLAAPPYEEGTFGCDGCGKPGTDFCYNCAECGIDLHVICASIPLSVNHGSHAHQLDLAFSPPYDGEGFGCDICRMRGSNHWLYRCHPCGFDAHVDCATRKVASAPVRSKSRGVLHNQQSHLNPGVQPARPGYYGVPHQQPLPPSQNYGGPYQQPIPQGNYGYGPNGGQFYQNGGNKVNNGARVVNGALKAVGKTVMIGLLGVDPGTVVQGIKALGIGGGGGRGGGNFGGGNFGGGGSSGDGDFGGGGSFGSGDFGGDASFYA